MARCISKSGIGCSYFLHHWGKLGCGRKENNSFVYSQTIEVLRCKELEASRHVHVGKQHYLGKNRTVGFFPFRMKSLLKSLKCESGHHHALCGDQISQCLGVTLLKFSWCTSMG